MQVGGVLQAGREQTLVLFALALAVELLPPLGKEAEGGLVASQHLHLLAGAVQSVAGGGILPGGVIQAAHGQLFHSLAGTAHEGADVNTGAGNGQQAYSGEDGVATADGVGHHKFFIAFSVGQTLQSTPGLVSGGIDAIPGTFLAILLLQQALEYPEAHGGLSGSAGLGDDVDGEVSVADEGDDIQQGVGGQAVACKENIRGILLLQVIEGGTQQVDHGAGTQVGTADADDYQHLRLLANLLRGCLDAGEFLLVIVTGEIHPAGKVTAGAIVVSQHGSGLFQRGLAAGQIVLGQERSCLGNIQR